MAEFKLDRIRFRWKGAWSSGTAYIKDDIVSYGGKVYVCIFGHTSVDDSVQGTDFYTDAFDSTNPKWTQMLDGVSWKDTWQPGTYYKVNDIVKYGGNLYQCIIGHDAQSYSAPTSATTYNVITGFDTVNSPVDKDYVVEVEAGSPSQTDGYFFLDDVQAPSISFVKGKTYTFDQTPGSNATFNSKIHPLYFSITSDGTNTTGTYYETGVTYEIDGQAVNRANYESNFATATTRKVIIQVGATAPATLYYFTNTSANRGGTINVAEAAGNFYLAGTENRTLSLVEGHQYIFDQTDNSNITFGGQTHPMVLSTYWDGHHNGGTVYENGVTYLLDGGVVTLANYLSGFATASDRKIKLIVPNNPPDKIYYYDYNQADTGNKHKNQGQYLHLYDNGEIGDTDIGNWKILSASDNWRFEWQPLTIYRVGDTISYGGILYRCVTAHTSSNTVTGLELDIAKWNTVIETDSWKGDWTPATRYFNHDIVRYGGVTKRCITGHVSQADDNLGIEPDDAKWETLIDGIEYIGNWQPREDLNVTAFTGTSATCVHNYTSDDNGKIFRYTTAGTVDTALTADKYYYLRYVDATNISFHLNKTDALFGRNAVTFNGDSSGSQTLEVSKKIKVGDIVRYGPTIFRCTTGHVPGTTFSTSFHTTWLPGLGFENQWQDTITYQPGDIVTYGGYSYTALTVSTASVPSANLKAQDTGDWELLTQGYRLGAQYNQDQETQDTASDWASTTAYKTGDVVRLNGHVFIALRDSTGSEPDDALTTTTYAVTVGNPGSGNKYYIDGVLTATLSLVEGNTYIFNQSDSTNSGHPIYISTLKNGHHNDSTYHYYQAGVTYHLDGTDYLNPQDYSSGFNSATVRYVKITVPRDAYSQLYPVCDNHSGMYDNGVWNTIQSGNNWQTLITGDHWRDFWIESDPISLSPTDYYLGDVVTYEGTLYRCVKRHTATASGSRPDVDMDYTQDAFWTKVIQGGLTNVLQYRGDIRTHDGTETVRQGIGNPGDVLKVINTIPAYEDLGAVANVYYVATNGIDNTDTGRGLSDSAPFKTVKYACDYIFQDEATRSPATIFVKTGTYKEQLPIKVPADVAIVGDELRSTRIEPLSSAFEDQDMFRVRNGCGIRNMTLAGLKGSLGSPDGLQTKRVTGGAFVALDPGDGPGDTSVWITNKSTYVQNVSTFGEECIGLRIDGDLHNGGNKSVVANDFTQILQQGIGFWCSGEGKAELVSVFTYYCHIGYLCTDGGKVRATNGNNSYGDFGSVAIGFDQTESPITGKVDNYSKEATISQVYNDENQLFTVGYNNAGNHYTNGTVTITGSGQNAAAKITEFRDNGIMEVRVLDPGDSSIAGGAGYTFVNNRAQLGDSLSINIANSDTQNETYYLNKLLTIVEGEGRGQYGYITSYDWNTGGVISGTVTSATDAVRVEGTYTGKTGTSSNGLATPPTVTLTVDATGDVTVTVTDVGKDNLADDIITYTNVDFGGQGANVTYKITSVSLGNKRMTIARQADGLAGWEHLLPGQPIKTVLDETTRYQITPRIDVSEPPYNTTNNNAPSGTDIKQMAYQKLGSNRLTVGVGNNSIIWTTDGTTWNNANSYTNLPYVAVAPGNNFFVAIDSAGNVRKSGDGTNWSSAGTLPAGTYNSLEYGDGYHVALANSDSNAYVSTNNGDTWATVSAGFSNVKFLAYGNGKWIAMNEAGDTWESTDNAQTWTQGPDLGNVQYDVASLCFGNGRFVAAAYDSPNDISTVNNKFFYSLTNKSTAAGNTVWLMGEDTPAADNFYVSYAQGVFVAVSANGQVCVSPDGNLWDNKSSLGGAYNGIFAGSSRTGGPQFFPTQNGTVSQITTIEYGARARIIPQIVSNRISEFTIVEAGSGYTGSAPTLSIVDPDKTGSVTYEVRLGTGVLGPVEFTNRGTGYLNIGVTVTGDGYKDEYQLGEKLIVKELSREPGPGDNLYINEINDVVYSIQSVANLQGSEPNLTAELTISPTLDRAESPNHEETFIIRQKYSQVRLTGHDFLEIGRGDLYQSNYPLLIPDENYEDKPFNETAQANGGRVFYTSTDQDGNFRVGELFEVEQSTGIVTLNASYFQLEGLTELRLGGVTLGGTNALIKEFSKDGTFAANSNEIVPTQRAVAAYIASRISGGGVNVNVNALISGEVKVIGNQITTTSGNTIQVPVKMNFQKGIDGSMAAMTYFTAGGVFSNIDEGDPTTPQEQGYGL
tara:strand:+ start:5050 stop:11670 length:6621 start_codon:yes stop_codon:yes gene_type:complete